MTGFDRY